MAYSLDRDLFRRIDAKFRWVKDDNAEGYCDWSKEIAGRKIISNLIQLTPSVGRMWRIGAVGTMRLDVSG
jgi:hypothetical protein